jgi:MFS family permease
MYWTGAFVSSVGTWLQSTAVLWFVRNGSSDTVVGLVNMAAWVPCLFFSLFAGAMSDRMDRRRVMLVTQAVMMACSVMMGVCIHTSFHDAALVAFLAVSGIAYAIFIPAWISAIPFLVARETLLSANTLNNVQFNLGRFIGPVTGGALLAATTDYLPFYLNALTFAVFMAFILVARDCLPPSSAGSGAGVFSGMFSGVAAGFRYVWENGWMGRVLLANCGLAFFGASFIVLLPSVCRQLLEVSENYYGLLVGMTGLGAVAGMVAVAELKGKMGLKALMSVGAFATAAFLIAFSFSGLYWLSCVLAAGVGGSFLVFLSAVGAALQGNCSPEMEGRIASMMVVAYVGIFPLGGLLLGYLSDALSLRTSLLIGGLASVAVALFTVLFVSVPEQ